MLTASPLGQMLDDYEQAKKFKPIATPDGQDSSVPEPVPIVVARRAPAPITPPTTPAPDAAMAPPIKQATPIGNPKLDADKAELTRLQTTGSGIDQYAHKPGGIGHKIASVLARIGDVAGTALFPTVMASIPGTTLHHNALENNAAGRVAEDLGEQKQQAQIDREKAETDALTNPSKKEPTNAFELWHQQNPQGTIEEWKKLNEDKNQTANTPEAGYAHAIADAIGRGVDPSTDPHVQAWKQAIDLSHPQKDPNRDDKAIAIMSKPESQWTPEDRSYMAGYKQYVKMNKVDPGVARISVLGDTKQLPVIDTQNGNALIYASANDINEANRKTPGRYVPAGEGSKALGKTALIEDIRGNINSLRDVLKNPKLPAFSADQRAKIAIALGSSDVNGAMDAMIRGGFIASLSPEQQDYVVGLSQLIENSMAMRSVLGAGQGSEDLRDAIKKTIPGGANPDAKYSLKQLDAFEAVLNRLERGVPNVPLTERGNTGTTEPTRPDNVPKDFVYDAHGPKGAGWYRSKGK